MLACSPATVPLDGEKGLNSRKKCHTCSAVGNLPYRTKEWKYRRALLLQYEYSPKFRQHAIVLYLASPHRHNLRPTTNYMLVDHTVQSAGPASPAVAVRAFFLVGFVTLSFATPHFSNFVDFCVAGGGGTNSESSLSALHFDRKRLKSF